MSLILRESIHVLACDSTRRRPRKIEAGTSHENHIQVACRRVSLYFFVLCIGETRPSACWLKRLNHDGKVMLAIQKSIFAMPAAALEGHVIVAYGLKLGHRYIV